MRYERAESGVNHEKKSTLCNSPQIAQVQREACGQSVSVRVVKGEDDGQLETDMYTTVVAALNQPSPSPRHLGMDERGTRLGVRYIRGRQGSKTAQLPFPRGNLCSYDLLGEVCLSG